MTAKTHVVKLADVNSPVAQWQSGWLLTTRLAVRVRLGEPDIKKAVFLRRNGFIFFVDEIGFCKHIKWLEVVGIDSDIAPDDDPAKAGVVAFDIVWELVYKIVVANVP